MANIGGNITGVIQRKSENEKNAIGEKESKWVDAFSFDGFLDLQSGDSKYTNFNAKVEESTHIFLSDFHSGVYALQDENTRMIIKGFVYDVLLIDNPMEMDEQLEIYLRKVGAWHG